ncbi:MAG TPA: LPXTG cell wall anchor domain-containing protein [Nocardioides sp.]|nr:LPXTG cell wall anchor domain-containing protein [Nocardioides sp.]
MSQRHLPRLVLAPIALATAAVIGCGAGASAATDAADAAACGQPAVPAVYETVEHPEVVTAVPALTHQEWRWQRSVTTTETEHSKVVEPARGTWTWTRTVDTVEREFVWTVVDRAHVAAVPETGHVETRVVVPAVVQTLWEYLQQKTGKTRWEIEGWNAGDNGKGWEWTGATDEVVVTPAATEQVWVVDSPAVPEVTELSHQETAWVADGTAPPAGSSATGATRVAGSSPESVELPDGESPAGAGWTRGAWTETAAAVTDVVWVAQGATVPAGYDATGATRPGAPVLEESDVPSALAPAGNGWEQVAGSETTVVDAAAYDRVDAAAWTEQVLVTPEVPATDACPEEPTDDGSGDGSDDGGDAGGEVGGEDDGTDGLLDGDVVVDQTEGEVGGIASTAAGGADVLPATGSGTEPWLLGLGAASLVAGAALVRGRREPAGAR